MTLCHRSQRAILIEPSVLGARFAYLSLRNSRSISTSPAHRAVPTLNPTTRRDTSASSTNQTSTARSQAQYEGTAGPSYVELSPAQRAAQAAERARSNLKAQQEKYAGQRQLGSLASSSLFADEDQVQAVDDPGLGMGPERQVQSMSIARNPNPNARARWQRKMIIRHVKHKGRLPREVQIARTERDHLAKSHFFKTSMKKLAPLARQIAGKTIDEAILQMRFSKKKAAQDVRAHLIQARNEAVVMKGMGLGQHARITGATQSSETTSLAESERKGAIILDPSISPPLSFQNPTKSRKSGEEADETEIYIAQAWVNRGPYGKEPEYRARGRVNILRPPWTGLSVVLKEEKTRTREKSEKEERTIKKRTGKNMWQQLPDRPITRQSQHVLW